MDRKSTIHGGVVLALAVWAAWGLLRIPATDEAKEIAPSVDAPTRPAAGLKAAPAPRPDGLRPDAPPSEHGGGPASPSGAARDVVLHVLGPDGRPAPRVWVQWEQHGGGFGSGRADDDGQIVLPVIDTSRAHRLQVMPHMLGDEVLPVDEPAWLPRDATIRLEPALAITGTVLDERGEPAREHGVFWRVVDGEVEAEKANLQELGRFRVAPLPPGRYQVCAVFNDPWLPHAPVGFAEGEMPDGADAQTVEAGTRDVTLHVRRGALLRVQILDWDKGPMSWGQVMVLDRDGAHFLSEIDYKGRVAFCRLPAEGLYRLRRYGLPGNRYVDAGDLVTGAATHTIRTREGLVIQGHLAVPADMPPGRVSVRAWPLVPGRDAAAGPGVPALAVQGGFDATHSRYVVQGLGPGRWHVQAAATVLREGVAVTWLADADVAAGEDQDLVLRAD